MIEAINSHSATQPDSKYTINVQQLKNSYQLTGPGNRMNHSMGYYNEQIFIIGGTSASNTRQDQHYLNVYCYSLETRQWTKKQFPNLIKNEEKERQKERQRDRGKDKQRQREKEKEKQKERERDKEKDNEMDAERQDQGYGSACTRSFMASCQKQHKLFLFGGSNHRNECNNELLVFDMRKFQWEAAENLQPPEPRQSAYLTAYMGSYLLLYGGIDLQKLEIYEHFYSYKIDTGVWRRIEEGNYRSILRPRYLTSLCSIKQGEKIFLFGGEYRNADGNHNFLSDFYEMTVSVRKTGKLENQGKHKNFPDEVLKIDCILLKGCLNGETQPSEKKCPQAKSAHKLLSLSDEYLALVGGANHQYYYLSNVWVYSVSNKIWRKIEFDFTIPKQAGIECCTALRTEGRGQPKQASAQKQKEQAPVKQREPKYLRELKQYPTTRRKDRREEIKQKQIIDRENDRENGKQKNGQKSDKKYSTVFIYGGLNSYDSVRGDLFRLEFQFIYDGLAPEHSDQKNDRMEDSSLTQRKNNGRQYKELEQLFQVDPLKKCLYCEFPREKIFISKGIVDSFSNMIPYPFNAIGLFLENAHNHTATEICVAYRNEILQLDNSELKKTQETFRAGERFETFRKKLEQYQQNFYTKTPPFIHVSENNQIQQLSYQQLKSSIKNFEYALYFTYHNIEKKVRTALQRQHQLHEYGAYLKAGALRLGGEFIYLSKGNSGQIRVFAYLEAPEEEGKEGEHNYYQFCSYVWEPEKKKIMEQPEKIKKIGSHHKVVSEEDVSSREYYEHSYNRINKKYEKYLSDLFQNNAFEEKSNHLLIFNLKHTSRKAVDTLELFPHNETVDICYTPYKRMLSTHPPGIYESIDLSMRAYMSCYFLKSEFPKMYIKVNSSSKPVAAQICLQSFALMAKNRCIYEIDNSIINIEVKLMELYFNPNLSTSMISFHNGILFYHKGRLVARHGCPIGELYRRLNGKTYNFFHLFGLLQVPEPILPNVFRTEFIYNVMMEKLRARLKFIEKMLLREFQHQQNPQLVRAAGHTTNALAFQTYSSQDKTVKITKKMSQSKQKKQKKEDVEFNPNAKY